MIARLKRVMSHLGFSQADISAQANKMEWITTYISPNSQYYLLPLQLFYLDNLN